VSHKEAEGRLPQAVTETCIFAYRKPHIRTKGDLSLDLRPKRWMFAETLSDWTD